MNRLLSILMPLVLMGCATRGFPPVHGIGNFDIVDDKVIRCGQFNAYGLDWLSKKYPKLTVINLRDDPWSEESFECAKRGVRYFNLPWNGLCPPSAASLESALQLVDAADGWVVVHCKFGCDRTGFLVACRRIRQGEANAAALDDAIKHGMVIPLMKERIKRFK